MRFRHILWCAIWFPAVLRSQQAVETRFLFLEWRDTQQEIVLGEFQGAAFKKKVLFSSLLQQLQITDVENWLGPGADGEALLFCHAMWGQAGFFMRKCLRSIDRTIQDQTNISTVIAVIWHAGGPRYVRNWEHAAAKGEALGPLLKQIHVHFAGKVEVLCHSMGNRLFAGMLGGVPGEALVFPNMILFSPDLHADTGEPDVSRLIQAAGRLTIFIHRRDRILLLSSWCHGRKRLGRSGLEAVPAASVTIVDMTRQVRGLQNHTHLDKKWVQAYWRRLLSAD